MTYRKVGLVAFIIGALVLLFAPTANAQEAPAEVTCTLVDETDPSVKNDDGSYDLGSTISLDTDYTDPDNRVQTFIFSEQLGSGASNNFDVGNAPFVDWTPSSTGTWTVNVEIRDNDNVSLCSSNLMFTIVTAQEEEPPPSSTTTSTIAPPTPTTANTVAPGRNIVTNHTPTTAATRVLGTQQEANSLPRTGKNTFRLFVTSLALIASGTALVKGTRKRQQANRT